MKRNTKFIVVFLIMGLVSGSVLIYPIANYYYFNQTQNLVFPFVYLTLYRNMDNFIDRVNFWVNEIDAWCSEVDLTLDEINGRLGLIESWQNEINSYISNLNNWRTNIDNTITAIQSWQTSVNNFISNTLVALENHATRLTSLEVWSSEIDAWQTAVNNILTLLQYRVDLLENWRNVIDSWRTLVDNNITYLYSWRDSVIAWQQTINEFKTWVNDQILSLNSSLSVALQRILSLETWQAWMNDWKSTIDEWKGNVTNYINTFYEWYCQVSPVVTPYEYIVYKSGIYYVAESGLTNMIVAANISFSGLLNNLPSPKSVFLKKGTYYVYDSPIILTSNNILIGEGWNTQIEANEIDAVVINSNHNLVCNLKIYVFATTASGTVRGVLLNSGKNVIRNVYFLSEPTSYDVYGVEMPTGYLVGNIVSNCLFHNLKAGVKLWGDTRSTISENLFDSCFFGIEMSTADNNIIMGNMFLFCGSYSIYAYGGADYNIIMGNKLFGRAIGVTGTGNVIEHNL